LIFRLFSILAWPEAASNAVVEVSEAVIYSLELCWFEGYME